MKTSNLTKNEKPETNRYTEYRDYLANSTFLGGLKEVSPQPKKK